MGTRDTSVFGPRRSLRRAEYPADRQERAPSSEQREARRETVQEVPPADRSDLAGAERARRRDRTEELVDEARVVVGDAEEVTAPAVAREQQRGTGVDTTEHLAQVLVGGGRVPYVELHRLADRHTIADRERTRLLVRAEHVPDEEVAAGELGLVLVDDEAHVQATAEQLAFVVADARGELLEPRDRRPAAELLDEVPLRTRDHERVADRPATLRDDRVDGDAFEEDATAPSASTDSSSARRLAPGRPPADARPPMTVRPGRSSLRRRRKPSTGNVNGSAKSSRVAGSRSNTGQPVTAVPSSVSSTRSATGVRPASGSTAAKTDSAGASSISWAPPITETAVPPRKTRGPSNWRIAPATSSKAPTKCGDAKHTTRSGSSPSSWSRICPAVSPTACAGTGAARARRH